MTSLITPEIIMAVCAVIVAVITAAALLIRQGRRMQLVKNIEDRMLIIENDHVNKELCINSKKACRIELVSKIENNKSLVTSEMTNLAVVVAETKVTMSEMCKETKAYRRESLKRWIETNKILAKVSAKLEVD